jgi:hypothetical protein
MKRYAHTSWNGAVWFCGAAGPSAALAFLNDCTVSLSLSCYPRLDCLRTTVDAAWATFVLRVLVILGLCASLAVARRAVGALPHGSSSLLTAAVASTLLSALCCFAVWLGMNAGLYEQTVARSSLVAIALGGVALSALSWRSLLAATRDATSPTRARARWRR